MCTCVDLLYPCFSLLQAERCLRSSIIIVLINMQHFLARPGECSSSSTASVRNSHPPRYRCGKAHSARRDWDKPVPDISTSQVVSFSDSIAVKYTTKHEDLKENEVKCCGKAKRAKRGSCSFRMGSSLIVDCSSPQPPSESRCYCDSVGSESSLIIRVRRGRRRICPVSAALEFT